MIRAFLALPLAGVFQSEISLVLRKLEAASEGIRWVRPEQVHVTFHFFGSITPEEAEKVKDIVSGITPKWSPFQLCLQGIGGFPHRKRPRVIWLGVEGGHRDRVIQLQWTLERAFSRAGFEVEERKFKPHATLGRVKRDRGKELCVPAALQAFKTEVRRIDRLILFRSHLGPEGPHYEPLSTFHLTKEQGK